MHGYIFDPSLVLDSCITSASGASLFWFSSKVLFNVTNFLCGVKSN